MGEVKNGIGNREFKELICTTHDHELKGGVEFWTVGGGKVEGREREEIRKTVIA